MSNSMYFEDWVVGHVYETASRRVTREIMDHFNQVEGHMGPMHNDPDAARQSVWGRMSMHGLLVITMATGLMADMDLFDDSAIAFLGMNWTFHKGVFLDDELKVRWQVADKRPTSKPGRGVIVRRIEVINQDGEVVGSGEMTSLWSYRSAGEAA